jgi:predicted lipoprotein with Yx(FWY)xxD motif
MLRQSKARSGRSEAAARAGRERAGKETGKQGSGRLARRVWLPVAGLAAAAFVLGACGSTAASSTSSTTSPATSAAAGGSGSVVVKSAMNAKLGDVLVDAKGYTLYRYSKDTSTSSACTGSCAATWPPLTVAAGTAPSGASGITGLATLRRADGTEQVTYKGMPLYLYVGDTAAGQANGNGVGGFTVVSAGGSSSSATTTTSAPSTGGGY